VGKHYYSVQLVKLDN